MLKTLACGAALVAALVVSQAGPSASSVPVLTGKVSILNTVSADRKKVRKPHPLLDCIPGYQGTEREYSECPPE